MKLLTILFAIFIVAFAKTSNNDLQAKWSRFKELHQKTYNKSEELVRIQIFVQNLKKVEAHNKLYEQNEVSFKMALNQFADLTSDEFLQTLTHTNHSNAPVKFQTFVNSAIPNEIDWRQKGAVTQVENQGQCGAASVYSVIGALEGQNFFKTGKLVPLSAQELADCASNACAGSSVEDIYKYVMEHGLSSAADYPGSSDGTCWRGSIPSSVTENGYVEMVGNEEALRGAVGTVGPVAVAVDASTWQFYLQGILACREDFTLNHGVLVVGYGNGNDGSGDYWLVKNSWGAAWGENGYVQVARNSGYSCGIAAAPTYPIV